MSLRKTFSENLRRLRKERKFTQERFAELCNISTNYVGYIEKQISFPSIELVEKMAEILAVEPHILFFCENSAEKTEKRRKEFRDIEKKKLTDDLFAAIKKVVEKY